MSDEHHNVERESDDGYGSDIHDFQQLLRSDDREGLISALENPELFRMACDDDRYMDVAMQGISVLAWDEPAIASELLIRFDVGNRRSDRNNPAGKTAWALMAALEWRQLESSDWQPIMAMTRLRDFLRVGLVLTSDDAGEEMRSELRSQTKVYTEFFQGLTERSQVLPVWIASLHTTETQSSSSEEESLVQSLTQSQFVALGEIMTTLRHDLKRQSWQYLVWALVVAAIVVMPNAMGALAAIVLLGGSMAITENKSYDEVVRPHLVSLAIDHGVGNRHVLSWIYRFSSKAGKVGNFDIKIENDSGLELLAALARLTFVTEERTDAGR